ncbi:nucleotidyltransferase domain-containing protein [Nocardioides vastitatis]|uniref:Nucleotidyltransferase domain-containing protein n=1 Tax=Nocardioides vastitatis TaxID=2568655 RepID=A0ABW0ZJE7_9ACTN
MPLGRYPPVPCLSVAQQQAFHSGDEHRPQDAHDLPILATLAAERSGT